MMILPQFHDIEQPSVSFYRRRIPDISIAEAAISGGELLTADHHEFDIIERNEKIRFCRIR